MVVGTLGAVDLENNLLSVSFIIVQVQLCIRKKSATVSPILTTLEVPSDFSVWLLLLLFFLL